MRKKSTLNKIDNYFSGRSENESQMIKLGAGVVVALLVYLIVFPPAQSFFDAKQREFDTATKNLNDVNQYLINNNDGTIERYKNSLAIEIDKLNNSIAENKYFDTKLREISGLTYNEQNWANFLDSLTSFAQEQGVKIYSIESETISQKDIELQKVQPMLDVVLKVEGEFHSILKYINSIEESEMVVDINRLDINNTTIDSKIGGDIGISVWGIKYR
ncbi:MAG: hypothetical protein GXZ15_01775 [Campylobacter sp.]|nr:hypothetical protein [Campylobacter sp.]